MRQASVHAHTHSHMHALRARVDRRGAERTHAHADRGAGHTPARPHALADARTHAQIEGLVARTHAQMEGLSHACTHALMHARTHRLRGWAHARTHARVGSHFCWQSTVNFDSQRTHSSAHTHTRRQAHLHSETLYWATPGGAGCEPGQFDSALDPIFHLLVVQYFHVSVFKRERSVPDKRGYAAPMARSTNAGLRENCSRWQFAFGDLTLLFFSA